jgi:diguanylate cyclase (GGDEF)-like protein
MAMTSRISNRPKVSVPADARIWAFAAFLAVAAFLLATGPLEGRTLANRPFEIPWWILTVLFFVSEVAVVHIQLKRQVFSASLSELPLVLGLYFVAPQWMIVAYVIGAGVALIVHRRQRLLKLVFNLCHFALQAALAALVFYSILGSGDPIGVRGLVAVFAATLLTDVFSSLIITTAMSLAEGRFHTLGQLVGVGSIASFANTALGLTCAVILWSKVKAGWLLTFPAVLLFLAYRAYVHQRSKHESLERLYDSTRVLQRSLGRQSVVEALLAQARDMLHAEIAEIIVFSSQNAGEADRTILGPGEDLRNDRALLDATEGIWARVASDGQGLLLVPPLRNEKVSDYFEKNNFTDAIAAPLRGEDGISGTLLVANRMGDVGAFDESDLKMLETLAAHASMLLEKGRLMETLQEQAAANEYLAKHDPLTGLFNRSSFGYLTKLAIDRAKRSDDLVAVLLMDLDRFKEINDTLGHVVGDQALAEVGQRLAALLPDGASLARVGGDEFAILLTGLDDIARATDQAKVILEKMKEPIRLAGATLDVFGSIGVTVYPLHARDADGLMQRADVAMYLAKGAHSGFEVYGADRDQYSPSRLALVSELREAIDTEQLVVFFQPKVSLTTGDVVGVEALVRWDHPRKGLVPPNEFIPLAEHTGLIKPLTMFVLRKSIQQLSQWRRMEPDLHVAVNLSVRLLTGGEEICDAIAALLDEYDVPPRSLELEITESSIMDDPVRAIGLLTRLSEMGIGLSIDDFGTGYSSMSYLKRLPVDALKIDKSFVLGMQVDENDAIIVRSIIDLGRNLGMHVIAEGVETDELCAALKSMGCDVAQGFGISRPLPAPKLGAWMLAHRAVKAEAPADSPWHGFSAAANN